MAKRELWPAAMQVWQVTGEKGAGKTRLASALGEAARQHGLAAEVADDVIAAGQLHGLLKMRTTAPDLLIVVSELLLDLPRQADMVLHLNRDDAGKVEQLAMQVWARESRKELTP